MLKNLRCALAGNYQRKNIATVLTSIDVLRENGFVISEKSIRKGFANVSQLTGLQGRWQIISKKPLTIVDTGHNEAGIIEVLNQLKRTPHKHLHIVLGMVNDKDPSLILKHFPKKATYYFCKANLPRSLNEVELKQMASTYNLKGECYNSVRKALKTAQTKAKRGDLVFVGGSTFVVAEVI